jgi:hypothetical protein
LFDVIVIARLVAGGSWFRTLSIIVVAVVLFDGMKWLVDEQALIYTSIWQDCIHTKDQGITTTDYYIVMTDYNMATTDDCV